VIHPTPPASIDVKGKRLNLKEVASIRSAPIPRACGEYGTGTAGLLQELLLLSR